MYFRRLAVKKKKMKKKKNTLAICGNNLLVKFIDLHTRVFYGSFLKIMKQKSNPTGAKDLSFIYSRPHQRDFLS